MRAPRTSEGSFGSPVVNIDGYVVAMQAGNISGGSVASYLLPLNRLARALKCLQQDLPIAREAISSASSC